MRPSIAIASLLYGVNILLSRMLGLIREAVIGRTIGGGAEADVYWASFILPDFLNYLLAGGVLSIAFIPLFQAHLARDDERGAWRAFNAVANPMLFLVLCGTGALYLAAPALAGWVVPGLSSAQHELWVRLVRIMLPAQIFHLVGGLISATLQARDMHRMPALAPTVYAGCVVLFGVVLGPYLGAEGFAWGVLVGSAAGPFGLPLWGAVRAGLRWRISLRVEWTHPDLRRYFTLAFPVMIGFSVVAFDDFVVKRLASSMDSGMISRLQYARTLMKVPMGVFGLATGMATYPTLARLYAQGRSAEGWQTLLRALRMMLILALGAQAALSVCAADVATLIWGTTRFSSAELQEIGHFTAWLGLGLWAWAAQSLVARGFYAQQNTWLPTLLGSAVMLLCYPLYVWLAQHHGGRGLTWASSSAISIYVGLLLWRLRRGAQPQAQRAGPTLPGLVLRLGLAMGAAVALGHWASGLLLGWGPFVRAALLGGLSLLVYFAVTFFLRVPEAYALSQRLVQRFARRRGQKA